MYIAGLTGVIPFTYFGGANKPVGSTFLRVDGLVQNSKEFVRWKHGVKYDNLIFQKAYWPEMMDAFNGPKILDICDPDWITGGFDLVEVTSHVHAVTCSSMELTGLVTSYLPGMEVLHVPDRLNFQCFPPARNRHAGKARTVVWFGFIHNAHETLAQMYSSLLKNKLKLIIIADNPYSKEDELNTLDITFIKYNQDTIYDHIRRADIVLNPRSSKALYRYKSNNKSLISWKLGVPVATTEQDLEILIDPDERNIQVEKYKVVVENEYNIVTSCHQYSELIKRIRATFF